MPLSGCKYFKYPRNCRRLYRLWYKAPKVVSPRACLRVQDPWSLGPVRHVSSATPTQANARMNEGEKTINYLPISTQSKLRSTQILTSLPQIISELIQNSLDAGARQVDIGVDCEEWECWVRDDGIGIKKDDLRRLGKGGRYSAFYQPTHTMQCNSVHLPASNFKGILTCLFV